MNAGKNVSSLFAKQTVKPEPAYDYSKVPKRARKRKTEEEEDSDNDMEQVSTGSCPLLLYLSIDFLFCFFRHLD